MLYVNRSTELAVFEVLTTNVKIIIISTDNLPFSKTMTAPPSQPTQRHIQVTIIIQLPCNFIIRDGADYFTGIVRVFSFAFSDLGILIFKIPLENDASILSFSTPPGILKVRWKAP